MEKELIIDRNYYLNFLIKIYRERHYHKDFQKLNKSKLDILNKYLGLEDKITFDFDKNFFDFKPFDTLNISRLKYVNGFESFNFEDQYTINNITSYISMYFNSIIDKLTNREYLISSGIELCTNDTNEFVKKIMNAHSKDLIISSHVKQIKEQYEDSLKALFNVIYGEDFMNPDIKNVKWDVKITKKTDINKLNKTLDEYEYF